MMKATPLIMTAAGIALFVAQHSAVAEDSAWKFIVELDDGSRIVGEPDFDSVRFQTSHGQRDIPWKSLVSARLENGKWVAHIDDGRGTTLSGKIPTETLRMKTLVGPVTLPLRRAVALESYETAVRVNLPARKDLVLYLNFDRNSGKRARNLVSNRHHADVRGAKWIPTGKRRGAYEFDGNGARLEIPHHEDLCPQALTLSAWVYPTDPAGNWRLLISKTNTGSWYGGYGFCRYSGDSRNLYFYAGNYSSGAAKDPIPQREWTHIAGVYDGKTVTMYFNGEPSQPRTLADSGVTMQHVETPFIIGSDGSGYGYDWLGKVDELMLFRRALTGKEIEQLMIATSPKEAESQDDK